MNVDWRGIRNALRMRRAEIQMPVNELRDRSGISRTTIYRIENVTDIPDHEMDLETVAALTNALGLTLSQLFGRIETLRARDEGDIVPSSSPHSKQAPSDPTLVSGGFSAGTPEAESQRLAALCLRAAERSDRPTITGILHDLAFAFQLGAFTPEQWARQQELRRQVAASRAYTPRSDAGDRGVG